MTQDRDNEINLEAITAIREAVEEMMMRMEGAFEMTKQDQEDLHRYREMNDYPGIPSQSTVATSFLRRHNHLIQ